jgi:predicted enzyme related to lactoylglutathione lyase
MMLKRTEAGNSSPRQLGYGTQSLTIFVEDVDGHFSRSSEAGARIVEDLHETIYGERQYGVEDYEGHHWLFSRHAKDLSPQEWGATVKEKSSRLESLPRPRFCYVEIPANAIHASVAFYEKVFGWRIRHRDSHRPSFDDATGNVSGAWVRSREIARVPGLLLYVWVDDIAATLALIISSGGEIVQAPSSDSPAADALIATFRDPAGNSVGLYQEVVRA